MRMSRRKSKWMTTSYSAFQHILNRQEKKLLYIISALICSFQCLTKSRCAGDTWGRTERSTMTTWRRQWHNIMNFLLMLLQRFTSLSYVCVTNITAERKTNSIFFFLRNIQNLKQESQLLHQPHPNHSLLLFKDKLTLIVFLKSGDI